MERDTYYDILGVPSSAAQDEIKAKYRKLIRRIHPDLDGPTALFRQVQEAYEVLSEPARRAAYDRLLVAYSNAAAAPLESPASPRETSSHDPSRVRPMPSGPGRARPLRTPSRGAGLTTRHGQSSFARWFRTQNPALTVVVVGLLLLVCGAALGNVGTGVIVSGFVVLVLAAVAGLGRRGTKEREAYRRSGMDAIDAMTGRQFEVLLEHLFATQGYRVGRIRAGDNSGVEFLLGGAQGRTVVEVRRRTGVVRPDAVRRAVVARKRYGVPGALVVTSSNYSKDAVSAANSNGVTLWNRATLAAQLSSFPAPFRASSVRQFSSDLRAGSRICLGFVATLFVVLVAARAKRRNRQLAR